MEPASELAPPVVAVMVVHRPGPWFDDVLRSLAAQDYANLKQLVLVAGEPGDLPERIRAAVPDAFVRAVPDNPGFGPAANEVLSLVEGDNGFFCFLHDDVALDPSCIRLLVEELYRSNAGVVGPKLVEWVDQRLLQHVGFGADRFGEIDPLVEHGEVDQEQHDAVRDVFALPSACLLVRADLFRTLGGFDPAIDFHGEDLDLCWRAHRSGARVVVVPSARGRHLESLEHRRPDMAHEVLRARHRLRTVATLTGGRRLPALSLQLVLVTIAEMVIGLFSGQARRGWAGVRALLGLVPRTPRLFARRRTVAATRHVPDREIVGLQIRGSARLTSWIRSRGSRPDKFLSGGVEVRSWRERSGGGAALAWFCVLGAILIGSRHIISDGISAFGQFLPFRTSSAETLRTFASGWWSHGAGETTAVPTGVALIGLGGVLTLFHTGLLHTMSIVGLLAIGALGAWRLGRGFSASRARIATMVVYVAVPLPAQLISVGRWGALACYAALPWAVELLRGIAGIEAGAVADDTDLVVDHSMSRSVRLLAGLSLVTALTVAFAPAFALLLVAVGVVLAVGSLAAGTPVRSASMLALGAIVGAAVGLLLNLPWTRSLVADGGWQAIVGPPPIADRGYSVLRLATFDLGNGRGAIIALAFYLPVIAAPLVARSWRFTWAVRAGFLVGTFLWLAVLDDAGSLPLRLPEPGVVLAPVALGLALAAGCVISAFDLDVKGGHFGWRQPLGILGGIAVAVGLLPGLLSTTTGRWDTPQTTMIDLLGQFGQHPEEGDYRTMWLGDQRLMPVAGTSYRPGISYALVDDGPLLVDQTWGSVDGPIDDDIRTALDAIASGSTARAGRLLAPFSIRYVVIPVTDGAISTVADPIPLPAGLLDAIGDQLDLGEVYSPPNFVVYENHAWVPERSVLTAAGAEASDEGGVAALAQADLAGSTPIMIGSDHLAAATAAVPAGTVHLSVPFDRRWQLEVDGVRIEPRPAFGATMAFDIPTAGTARLAYATDVDRTVGIVIQAAAWSIVTLAATRLRFRVRRPRRRRRPAQQAPIMVLDHDADRTVAMERPGDDTMQISTSGFTAAMPWAATPEAADTDEPTSPAADFFADDDPSDTSSEIGDQS